MRTSRVFISYSHRDKEIARRIVGALRERKISVWFDEFELGQGDSIANMIAKGLSSSDYLLVLLSPHSVSSKWVRDELNYGLLRQLNNRDITVVPVLIADCEIPFELAHIQFLDLRGDFSKGLELLVEQLTHVPDIDFRYLQEATFASLVEDILREQGFTNIAREPLSAQGMGPQVDMVAEYVQPDPFGVPITQRWLVEVKFYREARADLPALKY